MKTDFKKRYAFQRKLFSKFILNFDSLYKCYPLILIIMNYKKKELECKIYWMVPMNKCLLQ